MMRSPVMQRLKIISAERICDEMNKIMLSKHPSSGFYYPTDCARFFWVFAI